MDPFIGEIRCMPYTFAPEGWLACNGQQVSQSQFPALYAIIGTRYGTGAASGMFKLPDLRGRVPLGSNTTDITTVWLPLGQTTGSDTVTLTSNQLSSHSHGMNGALSSTVSSKKTTPTNTTRLGNVATVEAPGVTPKTQTAFFDTTTPETSFITSSIGPDNSSAPLPHNNQQPFLSLNFVICWDGIFPTQD
ncbi:MAG: tail fiber protein [Magnetococcales bacterium]|nr:tail fiber protein [Magnetococcales bacterium]